MREQRGFILPTGPAAYLILALGVALALSWAGAGLAVWWLDRKVDAAVAEAAKLREEIGRETQSRAQFQASAKTCSDSVDELARQAERDRKAFAATLAKSLAVTADANRLADAVLAAGRPPGLDECAAMRKELDDEIDRRAARR